MNAFFHEFIISTFLCSLVIINKFTFYHSSRRFAGTRLHKPAGPARKRGGSVLTAHPTQPGPGGESNALTPAHRRDGGARGGTPSPNWAPKMPGPW
ncbi:hypothetical protein MTBLM5_130058 [Magnetospirillum sp. LM-5]|nr:hypothetical protein MTBLM5_130058 [Magnetospirillum sp. LM-5]